jgi:hypothetical protein
MLTYQNTKYGFELKFPEGWVQTTAMAELLPQLNQELRSTNLIAEFFAHEGGLVNVVIDPMCPELPPDVMDMLFTKRMSDLHLNDIHFGRIIACKRQHSSVSFVIGSNCWIKKYSIVVNNLNFILSFMDKLDIRSLEVEQSWDEIASTFRFLQPIDPSVTRMNSDPSLHQAIERLRKELKKELNLSETIIYL